MEHHAVWQAEEHTSVKRESRLDILQEDPQGFSETSLPESWYFSLGG